MSCLYLGLAVGLYATRAYTSLYGLCDPRGVGLQLYLELGQVTLHPLLILLQHDMKVVAYTDFLHSQLLYLMIALQIRIASLR